MRHLWSLLAGVVAAPLAWLFLATGQHRAEATVARWDETGLFDTVDLVGPAAFLAAAGILLGLLGTLRWSPAGPFAAGILLVLPTVFMFINPFRTLDAFSHPETRRVFGQDFQPWLPVTNGTLLVLGALLLMALFSASRWRSHPTPAAPVPLATDQQVVERAPTSREEPAVLDHSDTPRPAAMSDEEILAAAAALDEQEAGTTGDLPTRPADPESAPAEPETPPHAGEPPEPAAPPPAAEPPEPEPEPDPDPEPDPEPDPDPETDPETGKPRRPTSGTGTPGTS